MINAELGWQSISQWHLAQSLFGVILTILTIRKSLPVFPWKQTFSEPGGTSRLCH